MHDINRTEELLTWFYSQITAREEKQRLLITARLQIESIRDLQTRITPRYGEPCATTGGPADRVGENVIKYFDKIKSLEKRLYILQCAICECGFATVEVSGAINALPERDKIIIEERFRYKTAYGKIGNCPLVCLSDKGVKSRIYQTIIPAIYAHLRGQNNKSFTSRKHGANVVVLI
jgi:hypothetical protein